MGRQRSSTATRLIRGFLALAVGVIGTPIVLVASMASPAAAMPTNAIAELPVTPSDAGPLATTRGVTARGAAGTYSVIASAAGPLSPATFTLTNTEPDPAAATPAADTTGISGTLPFTGGPIAVLVQLALLLIGFGVLAGRYPSRIKRRRTS